MWKYQRDDPCEFTTITCAKRPLTLFGANCTLSFSVTSVRGEVNMSAINFALIPERESCIRINHSTGGAVRVIEQRLSVPHLFGGVLELCELNIAEDVFAARTVSDAFLQVTAAIVEHVRQSFRKGLGKDCRQRAYQHLQLCYEKEMGKLLDRMLGEINWKFMLGEASDQFYQVVQTTFRNHHIKRYPISHEGPVEIIPISATQFTVDASRLADLKAATLIRHVCGQAAFDEFQADGCVSLESHGYKFKLRPGAFMSAVDPQGGKARLCIHTIGFSVNPIDEIVLAYQYIKYQFDWYMKTANVFRDGPFVMP